MEQLVSNTFQHTLSTPLESSRCISQAEWNSYHSYNPHGVLKAMRCLDSSLTNPWWYALPWSSMENQVLLPKLSSRSWIHGNGLWSGTVFRFSPLKSTHSLRLWSFFEHKPLHKPLGRHRKTQIYESNLCLGDSAYTLSPPYLVIQWFGYQIIILLDRVVICNLDL